MTNIDIETPVGAVPPPDVDAPVSSRDDSSARAVDDSFDAAAELLNGLLGQQRMRTQVDVMAVLTARALVREVEAAAVEQLVRLYDDLGRTPSAAQVGQEKEAARGSLADEIALKTGRGPYEARDLVEFAAADARTAPMVEKLQAGEVTWDRCRWIWKRVGDLTDEQVADVARVALRPAPGGDPLPWEKFCREVARMVAKYRTPERRDAKRHEDRSSRLHLFGDGTAELTFYGAATTLIGAQERIDALARKLRQAGDPRTLSQLRHDIGLGLLLHGQPTRPSLDKLAGKSADTESAGTEGVNDAAGAGAFTAGQGHTAGCAGRKGEGVATTADPLAGDPAAASPAEQAMTPSDDAAAGVSLCAPSATPTAADPPAGDPAAASPAEQAMTPSDDAAAGVSLWAPSAAVSTPTAGPAVHPATGQASTPGDDGSLEELVEDVQPGTATGDNVGDAGDPEGVAHDDEPTPEEAEALTAAEEFGASFDLAFPPGPLPTATVSVVISAASLLGATNEPGEVPGHGWVDAHAVRDLAHAEGSTWRRIITDPVTGYAMSTVSPSYTPPKNMAAAVRDRDGTCRFPGCTKPAERSDLDHVREHPVGETSGENLQSLHRRHHNRKTRKLWRARMTPDGTVTWLTPLGQVHSTTPFDYRPAFGDSGASDVAGKTATGKGATGRTATGNTGWEEPDPGPPPF